MVRAAVRWEIWQTDALLVYDTQPCRMKKSANRVLRGRIRAMLLFGSSIARVWRRQFVWGPKGPPPQPQSYPKTKQPLILSFINIIISQYNSEQVARPEVLLCFSAPRGFSRVFPR